MIKRIITISLILAFSFSLSLFGDDWFVIKRVIDGDTVLLSSGQKVRYIGIDTPETKHPRKGTERFGKEACNLNRKLVEGKKVRLEFDAQKQDQYGRLLAYLYLEDGTFVNAEIIKQGYAHILTIPPNVKYADLFLSLQQQARQQNKGLWSIENSQKDDESYYIGNKNSRKFHRPSCRYLPGPKNSVTFKSRSEAFDAGYSRCSTCSP